MYIYTKEKFIELANIKHHNKYTYNNVIYVNSVTKVIITCPIHGNFSQIPGSHLQGKGCQKCQYETLQKLKVMPNELFIVKANKIHNNRYKYIDLSYKNLSEKISIYCPIHGFFVQRAASHLRGNGCPHCASLKKSLKNAKNIEEFIIQASKIHKSKYSYKNTIYKNDKTLIEIICPFHGSFWQLAGNHIAGHGCPKCKRSRGEIKVEDFLIEKKIAYKSQVKLDKCKNKRKLPFDFGIYKNNKLILLIEYQGRQHYHTIDFFGGSIKEQEKLLINDNIKREYCNRNNIPLLEIPFNNFEKIETILISCLNDIDYFIM